MMPINSVMCMHPQITVGSTLCKIATEESTPIFSMAVKDYLIQNKPVLCTRILRP